jgi:hypothetical protein
MNTNCPCCRAINDAGPICRRCKADLSLLFALESRRGSLLATAKQFAADGQYADALFAVHEADSLRRGQDTLQLHATLRLLIRDFTEAYIYYRAATKS